MLKNCGKRECKFASSFHFQRFVGFSIFKSATLIYSQWVKGSEYLCYMDLYVQFGRLIMTSKNVSFYILWIPCLLLIMTYAINADIFCKYFMLFSNTFHLLRWNISLKLSLLLDKNISLSHTAHNTDRTMRLSNKPKCYLFTAMSKLHSSMCE